MANPAEPKRLLILQDIMTTLKSIRRSDGYWFDIDEHQVVMEATTDEQIADAETPFLVVLLSDADANVEVMPRRDEEVTEYFIDGVVKNTAGASERATMRERAIADVRKALQVDTQRGTTGGVRNAQWTKITGVTIFDGAAGYENYAAFRVSCEVRYRYTWSQP